MGFLLVIIFLGISCMIILLILKILHYKILYQTLEIENNYLKFKLAYQKNAHQNNDKNVYDDDIREAVKYAMKKSHPDNGGSSDEFKKFRELYNRVK